MADLYLTADSSVTVAPAPYAGWDVVNPTGINNFNIRISEDSNVVVAGDVNGDVNLNADSSGQSYNVTTTVLADTTGSNAGVHDLTVNGGTQNGIVSTINVVGDASKFDVDVDGGPAGSTSTITVDAGASLRNYVGSSDNDVVTINGTAGNITTVGGSNTVTVSGTAGNLVASGGKNTFNVSGTAESVVTGGGNDAINVSGTVDSIDTQGGADVVNLSGSGIVLNSVQTGSGADVVTVSDSFSVTGAINTEGGNDRVETSGDAIIGSIVTSTGADTVSVTGDSLVTGRVFTSTGEDNITVDGGTIAGVLDSGAAAQEGDTITLTNSAKALSGIETGAGDNTLSIDQSTVSGGIESGNGSDTFSITNSTVTGNIELDNGLDSGRDSLTIEDSTINGSIYTYAGRDTVSLKNATIQDFVATGAGSDVVNLAGTVTVNGVSNGGSILTLGEEDTINVRSDATLNMAGNISTGGGEFDRVNIYPETQATLDALTAAGYSDRNDDGTYNGSDNESFTANGATFTNVENASMTCFGQGTLIETDRGPVAIEELSVDDLVLTRDNGFQPIRWIGSTEVSSERLEEHSKLRPVRIRRHALGTNVPSSDLLVSPQHRILVRSAIAKRMFGAHEVLVAAKHLVMLEGIEIAQDIDTICYFHMLFDRHEVVISNGAESESLYTGPQALKSVGPAAIDEIFTLFPELKDRHYMPTAARPLIEGRKGRNMAVRHKESGKALVN